MIVTLNCKECSNYFRIEAFEPEDELNRMCENCEELADQAACSHDHVHVERFDAGRAMDTGYHDAGELIVCEDCGFQEVA
jgi:hypothetical protein